MLANSGLQAVCQADRGLRDRIRSRGHPVDGLTREQFQVLDNGKAQTIRVFEPDTEAISCALLIDTTGSMKNALPEVVNATRTVIEALRPGDSASVYSFSEQLTRIQQNTTDKALLGRALIRLRAAGRTALFDSLSQLATRVGATPRQKGHRAAHRRRR